MAEVYRAKNDDPPDIALLTCDPWEDGAKTINVYEPYTDGGRYVRCPWTFKWTYHRTFKAAKMHLVQNGVSRGKAMKITHHTDMRK